MNLTNKTKKDWNKTTLGNILSVSSGKGIKINGLTGGIYPVYGGNGINGYHTQYLLEQPTLIIGRVGVKCGVMHITKPKCWVSDNALIVEPKIKDFDIKFFKLKLGYENLNKLSVSTAQPVISGSKLYAYEINYPNLQEQQAIVSKIEELFSELDKGIEQLKTAQQQLKTYRQSVLKWAFEGKLKTTIGELFDFVGGGTPSKKETSYWIGNIPWASVKDVKGDYLNDTADKISEEGLENSASNIAKANEVILVTRISPGKAIITNIDTAINQDLKIVKPRFKTTSKFVYYVFKSIERECIKKSSGTTVLGINLVNLKEIEIPKLTIEEQNNIVQEIESRLSVADKMEESITQSLQQAEALRQSILKKAFEGRLI